MGVFSFSWKFLEGVKAASINLEVELSLGCVLAVLIRKSIGSEILPGDESKGHVSRVCTQCVLHTCLQTFPVLPLGVGLLPWI